MRGVRRHVLFNWLAGPLVVAVAFAGAYSSTAPAGALGPNAIRAGFDVSVFPGNDDGSTAVALPFSVNFFGGVYSSLSLNNNGNVTFDGALGTFTPFSLASTNRVIIAPFFADVDTRTGNTVRYGSGTVGGRQAWGATWPGVGCFATNTSVLNYFQLILIDRSDRATGDFDIEFNYDQIQWETGQASGGNPNCLGGNSSRVGYSDGTGEHAFELPGSGVNGAFLDSNGDTGLVHTSVNSSQLGRQVFAVHSGEPATPTTLTLTPETATNPVNTQHCVNATVLDQHGAPVEGLPVSFTVTGANPRSDSVSTAANGTAQFCYTGTNVGDDTITAAAGDLSDTASKTWTGVGSRTISTSGPLKSITIAGDLGCAVVHSGVGGPDFDAFDGATSCGTLVAVGTTLFGPASIPGGEGAAPRTAYTPVSQTPVTGAGTAASPFRIVTVVNLGSTGFRLTQTDSYVVGEESYQTDLQLTNTGGARTSVILYRAGDCSLRGNDSGLGRLASPPPPVACLPVASPPAPSLVLEWVPSTVGSRFFEATANEVWTKIGSRQSFPNTCRCNESIDNAGGLSWDLSVAGGGASAAVSHFTNFRSDFASGNIPPGGGSISTGSTATPTDNTVSTFTVPPGGPGVPNATLTESKAPPGFVGQQVSLSPFTGYNDFDNAPTWTTTYDASLGLNVSSKTYYIKPGTAFMIQVPPCGPARYTPCVLSQTIVAGGDLQVVLKIRSDDPKRLIR